VVDDATVKEVRFVVYQIAVGARDMSIYCYGPPGMAWALQTFANSVIEIFFKIMEEIF
jgi:hypothetical protein